MLLDNKEMEKIIVLMETKVKLLQAFKTIDRRNLIKRKKVTERMKNGKKNIEELLMTVLNGRLNELQ